ncbi:helix-turn-helix domain-containing protein [Lichenibacterium dinghuense]|uniref:helix-turn-helix domain-containing protein n=1 Tax=Lichenibacterium dinghuense TaxID=2895977 RepID=UPI001F2F6860|nr:helix-turn-helix transcriptional regulator [Lichenibacterium sp. 6Y81]
MARVPRAPKKAAGDQPPPAPERLKRVKRNPEFDISLGARIRAARLAAHMSQGALGQAVGISFQQVQKYELGRDRVAVSTLHAIAVALGVHAGSFFDEDMPAATGPIPDVKAVIKLGQRIQRVRDPVVAKRLLALADMLAGSEDEQSTVTGDGAP